MPPGTLDFLEEPIRSESPEAYELFRAMTDTPFAIGEESSTKWAFIPFIEPGLANFVCLDICNIGGDDRELFPDLLKLDGSRYPIPTGPGLDIDVG